MEMKALDKYTADTKFPFWIKRDVHDAAAECALHAHHFVELIYVVSGTAIHQFQQSAYEIRSGDMFVINPGEAHRYAVQPGQRMEIVNCLFRPEVIGQSLLGELHLLDSLDFYYVQPFLDERARFQERLNLRGEAASHVLRLLDGMQREMTERRRGFQSVIRVRMVELLIMLSRYLDDVRSGALTRVPKQELLVRRICGFVERHYAQKITLQQLSDRVHLGTRQLQRQFQRYTGRTVIEYIQQLRLEQAKRLLMESDQTITAIAHAVGYEDTAFFSALFSREVGCSPGKYREG